MPPDSGMDEVSDVRRNATATTSTAATATATTTAVAETPASSSSNLMSSPVRNDEPDPRQSLRHVLAAADPLPPSSHPVAPAETSNHPKQGGSHKNTMIWIQEGGREYGEDEGSTQNDSYTRASEINPSYTMTVTHTRRNANGTIGSVYSGNKIRHLKKDDGVPLWRRDIQYAFLRAVFEDTTPVFTLVSDCTTGHTFADIYIDAMARSSKTSKVLKDKLLTDRAAALNMAMVCLLVNVGRMNTTLNFFPEMRAQLRTYHSIPSLQAHQDAHAYKQLQDAPRLKSILKGASEDSHQPSTLEKIKAHPVPRTNPVNLIFVLSQYAPKISETHFLPPRDFFDLVMRATLSSRSRAKAFLWLVWFYLESDFSGDAAERNPFGRGQHGEGAGGLPLKVPAFEHLTEEQANAENVDTESEKAYGEKKRLERKRILVEDETAGPPTKKGRRNQTLTHEETSSRYVRSDTDRTPSPPNMNATHPLASSSAHRGADMTLNGYPDDSPGLTQHGRAYVLPARADASHPQRIVFKTRVDHKLDISTPAPPGMGHPIIPTGTSNGHSHRRSRPETSHQKAVNMNRKMRIDHILHKQMLDEHRIIRKGEKRKTSSFFFTAMRRIHELPDGYNTESENSWGPGGLVPNLGEKEDFGEAALRHKKVLDRAMRRLPRDDHGGPVSDLIRGFRKRKRKDSVYKNGGESSSKQPSNHVDRLDARADQTRNGERQEGLDDLDLDLLGESRDDDRIEDEVDEESVAAEDSEGEGDDATEDEMTHEG